MDATTWDFIEKVAAALAVFAAAYALYRFLNSARLALCVLPPEADAAMLRRDYFRSSRWDEIRLRWRARIGSGVCRRWQWWRVDREPLHVRAVDGTVAVPFMMQNVGNNIAERIVVAIRVEDEEVHIRDFVAETFTVNDFFTAGNPPVPASRLSGLAAPSPIVEQMKRMGLADDSLTVCISGAFSAGAFEVGILTFSVPRTVSAFDIVFRVESPEIYHKRALFIRRIAVQHVPAAASGAAPSPA